MRIATWNVNSVRARLPRLVRWLERRQPDVVCLQETKVVDEEFPRADLEALGYHCTLFGQKTYNGVAILSREQPRDTSFGFPEEVEGAERRLVAASIGAVRVVSVYVPNGKDVEHPAYRAKLAWLERLREYLAEACAASAEVAVCGDFNVAPDERDVWDVELWRGRILFSDPERAAFQALLAAGFVDTFRLHHPEGGLYTWWDYRQGAFHRGWGLRIDHILASRALADRCVAASIDRDERKGEQPSDHAPLLAEFTAPAARVDAN
jgi:exodeoxyribonuclease-3